MSACVIDGCTSDKIMARGLCNSHYLRERRHGHVLAGGPPRNRGSKLEQWWAKVDKNGPVPPERPDLGQCWLWTAQRTPDGYGRITVDRRPMPAHRFGYEALVGPIPDGLHLDHLCVNPPCVRPSHLEPVTNRENILRSTSPGGTNARKTHCPQGHPYDDENTRREQRRNGSTGRRCVTCDRERQRGRRAQRVSS